MDLGKLIMLSNSRIIFSILPKIPTGPYFISYIINFATFQNIKSYYEFYIFLNIIERFFYRSSKGSVFHALNCTQTRFGARLFRDWLASPLANIEEINERLVNNFFKELNGNLT